MIPHMMHARHLAQPVQLLLVIYNWTLMMFAACVQAKALQDARNSGLACGI